MTDAGFYRGTNSEQDSRFSDKNKKLMKQMKFSDCLEKKIDISKINLDVIKPWITQRLCELLNFEDDVVIEFVFNQLTEKIVDPKLMQINLTGFLNAKNARIFMGDLWQLLLSAQDNIGGIPEIFIQQKKEEILKKYEENTKINATMSHENTLKASNFRGKNDHYSSDAKSKSATTKRSHTDTEARAREDKDGHHHHHKSSHRERDDYHKHSHSRKHDRKHRRHHSRRHHKHRSGDERKRAHDRDHQSAEARSSPNSSPDRDGTRKVRGGNDVTKSPYAGKLSSFVPPGMAPSASPDRDSGEEGHKRTKTDEYGSSPRRNNENDHVNDKVEGQLPKTIPTKENELADESSEDILRKKALDSFNYHKDGGKSKVFNEDNTLSLSRSSVESNASTSSLPSDSTESDSTDSSESSSEDQ